MVKRRTSTFTIKFGSDVRSQASVATMFAAMAGREAPDLCARCGGVTNDKGGTCPTNGLCKCQPLDTPTT